MKIKITISYEENLENITKMVKKDGYIDFHRKDYLRKIPEEWIESIEIIDDSQA